LTERPPETQVSRCQALGIGLKAVGVPKAHRPFCDSPIILALKGASWNAALIFLKDQAIAKAAQLTDRILLTWQINGIISQA
jgi:hypothetical protein